MDRKNSLIMLIVIGGIVASGCGTFGGTRSFVMDSIPPADRDRPLIWGGLGFEEGASKTRAVGRPGFSGFDEKTWQDLAVSLEDSLLVSVPEETTQAEPLKLFVFVRRYMVVAGNNSCAAMACVSWALFDGEMVVHTEEFYASGYGYLVYTAGHIKNKLHRVIVNRIVSRARWASRPDAYRGEAPLTEKTFDRIHPAITSVPKRIYSVFFLGEAVFVLKEKPSWVWVAAGEPVDWNSLVKSGEFR